MKRTVLHVDLDAFFASVEELDHPELRGKPLVVGGPSKRGVVAAASYAARVFGVRSAMPMVEALRRCPSLVVVPPSRHRYEEVSDHVFSIFHRFTPLVEGLSIDEAFLDVTRSRSLFGDGESIALQIRSAIRAEVGITASAGVAPNKFVAKIASDLKKPDGLVVVHEEQVRKFLADLPVERMWGLGQKSAARARACGFYTFADLGNASSAALEKAFGAHGPEMGALARGEDEREVVPNREAKSIGAEETFEQDLRTDPELRAALLAQCDRVAQRLRAEGLAAQGLTVKLKYYDFRLQTRQAAFDEPTRDTAGLHALAVRLLERFDRSKPVRLTGVSAHDLVEYGARPVLFSDPSRRKGEKVEDAVAQLRAKFGADAVSRAATLRNDKKG